MRLVSRMAARTSPVFFALGLSLLAGGCSDQQPSGSVLQVDRAEEQKREQAIADAYKKNPPSAPQKAQSREDQIKKLYGKKK
jgi:hypothetical protein